MANDKDFLVNGPVSVGKDIKVTVGSTTSGSVGYSLAGASYDSKSFDHSSDAGIVLGMYMKSDGTKMYLSSSGSGTYTDSIIEYALSTAWDISTASYNANVSVASQDTTPYGVFFKPDGLTMFVLGRATGFVYQYTLSTAWDVSTATYASKSFGFTTQVTLPSTGFFFKSDGSIMYIMESTASTNVNVYQYDLSTAWDVSSAAYSSKSYAIDDGLSASLFFTSDGKEMYHNVYSNTSGLQDIVRKHTLSTAWDISTASVSTETLDVSGQDTSPYSLWFKPDGSKLYVGGVTSDTIYQYSAVITTKTLDLSTGNYFNHTLTENTEFPLANAGDVQAFQLEVTGGAVGYDLGNAVYDSVSFSVASQTTSSGDIAFNGDGTKAYVMSFSLSAERVYQYSLSTAYDVSTMSYDSISFNVKTQAPDAVSVMFNTEGTKMYVGDFSSDSIYQYSLSTAFDLSTASYDSVSFSANSEDTSLRDATFSVDGTKLYIVGTSTDSVYQYSLSTPFDIDTASYDSVSFDVSNEIANPYSIIFNADGTNMFVSGSSLVQQYNLSTGYDLSTASTSSVSYTDANVGTTVRGLVFNNNGTKMYWLNSNTVYQYSTATDTTLTWPSSIEWAGGIAPAAPANGETDVFTFTTDDSGTTYTGVKSIDNAS